MSNNKYQLLKNSRQSLALATALVLAIGFSFISYSSIAKAQGGKFPEHTIRYVLHVSPGGATDILARLIAKPMSKELGVPIKVENRPGGGGAAEMRILTHSKPDGYTIGSVTASHIGRFHTTLRQYNVDSISWIAGLVLDPFVLTVPADSQFQSLKDLVQYTKKNPNKLSVGSFGGVGSASNIAWNMLSYKENLQANWVPYKSVGDAVTAALGRHIDVAIAYSDLVRQYVAAHKLRALAVLADKRVSSLPATPTFRQAGYPLDSSWQQFRGIIAPKGTPDRIKKILSNAALKALKTKTVQDYIKKNNLVDGAMDYKQFTQYATHQNTVTVDWLKKLNLLK